MGQKTLHIDPFCGASGDMLLGMFADLGADMGRVSATLQLLGLEPFSVRTERVVRHGIAAMAVTVDAESEATHHHTAPDSAPTTHDHHKHGHHERHGAGAHSHHHHSHHTHDHHDHAAHAHDAASHSAPQGHAHGGPARCLADMLRLLEKAPVADRVKSRAEAVFRLIAGAEARIHGKTPESVHFHEINGLDTIIDVLGGMLALESLAVGQITCSPITLGSGLLRCAHGVMPLPAPATAAILEGIPTRQEETGCELCTPTGAAMLRVMVDRFGVMDAGVTRGIGYGAGGRDLPDRANVIRGMLRETAADRVQTETIAQLTTALDDATGEMIGHAIAVLLEDGALDAHARPVTMKKSRPGVELVVLARPSDRERLARRMMMETGAFGVRMEVIERAVAARTWVTVTVAGQSIRIKCAMDGDTLLHAAPEYEDCVAASRALGLALPQVMHAALAAFGGPIRTDA